MKLRGSTMSVADGEGTQEMGVDLRRQRLWAFQWKGRL